MTSYPASIRDTYFDLIASKRYQADQHQQHAVQKLDALAHALEARSGATGLFHRLMEKILPGGGRPIRGAYLQGSVGRGKTWLMDLFFETLQLERKRRVHFHRFMQRIHNELAALGNVSDPLPRIAQKWARSCRLLCLDEFFVSDIGDAMILAGLFEALFESGVTLVTTSNVAPDALYKDGLQRQKFLPAIELIKANTELISVDGDTDYRLRILERSETYHCPLDTEADLVMENSYDNVACGSDLARGIEVNGRTVLARRRSDGVAWFEFAELCEKPVGSADYIELARAFNTILISNVPALGEESRSAAKRFIKMIDEFYDRNVKVLLSAAVPVESLYSGSQVAFEFQRTTSRLTEMQTHDYLARPHRP